MALFDIKFRLFIRKNFGTNMSTNFQVTVVLTRLVDTYYDLLQKSSNLNFVFQQQKKKLLLMSHIANTSLCAKHLYLKRCYLILME